MHATTVIFGCSDKPPHLAAKLLKSGVLLRATITTERAFIAEFTLEYNPEPDQDASMFP